MSGISVPILPDGGPWYAETDLSHFPVEPWNAWSSLTFLIPAIYWIWRNYKSVNPSSFLLYACMLLILGGIGSALYHAFRSQRSLLLMDIVPVAMLTISVSIYFWHQLLRNRILVAALTIFVLSLRVYLYYYAAPRTQFTINTSYFISGTFMLLPVVLLLYKTQGRGIGSFLGTLFFLITALSCRAYDDEAAALFPMGSHFLWHSFTSVAAWFLGNYLFYFKEKELLTE